jgi:hypothetical protein
MVVEIHKADPKARRWLTIVFVLTIIAAVFTIFVLRYYKDDLKVWAKQNRETAAQVRFYVLTLSMIGPLFILSLWARRFSLRIQKADRFPPPKAKLLRDIPIRTGRAAARYARFFHNMALFGLLTCIMICILMWLLHSF